MAVRRSDGDGSEYEDERFIGDPGGQGVNVALPTGGGSRIDEFGNVVPDFAGDPNFPTPFVDYQPEEFAGNTEPGRSFQRGGETPAQVHQPLARQEGGGLPHGVSVNDAPMDTPSMPSEPTPLAASPANPMSSQAPTMSGGPQRRSQVNPQIFGESRSPMMRGRAGGLMAGGLGATGGGELSGPIAPTEMMKRLMQMFETQ